MAASTASRTVAGVSFSSTAVDEPNKSGFAKIPKHVSLSTNACLLFDTVLTSVQKPEEETSTPFDDSDSESDSYDSEDDDDDAVI
jgi:hypothetical protein